MKSKEKDRKDLSGCTSKQKRKSWKDWILAGILIAGLAIALYPIVSDWVNSRSASIAAAQYEQSVEQMDPAGKNEILEEAKEYNRMILADGLTPGILSASEKDAYWKLFGGSDQHVIATLEIPVIDVRLPVYKGTDEEALKSGIGHLEGSSVPVGGTGTHAVLSGHRGLPSMKLLSQLDQVAEGDVFVIRTLGETMTYQVDAIHVVEPEDLHFLQKDPGRDQATLVTCTPYGINSHRLLVTGHRVSNELDPGSIRADAGVIDPMTVALWIGGVLVLGIMGFWMWTSRRKQESRSHDSIR